MADTVRVPMTKTRRFWMLACLAALLVPVLVIVSCDRKKEEPDVELPDPLPPGPTTLPVIVNPAIPTVTPGTELGRYGDEIMVAGRLFRTGTRVVLWTDPGGYDAYRTERRFSPWAEAPWQPGTAKEPAPKDQPSRPARFGVRDGVLNWPELELVRGGGWPLEVLQTKIDQFVLHYDVVGFSKFCFKTLHDGRGLSVHFMLDVDGTIYQTLDVKERTFHATTSNHRSIGIEIANRGAWESDVQLREFYTRDEFGARLTIPARFGDGGLLVPGTYRPLRPEPVRGRINNLSLVMYDFTPQQYDALTRLTATLCTVLPRITLDYPKDARGRLVTHKLSDSTLLRYQGVIGHYHIQSEKYDPGPSFDWDLLIGGARKLMSSEALEANRKARGSYVRPGTIPIRSTSASDR